MSAVVIDDKGIVLKCPACGQQNRTPFDRLHEKGTCGSCFAELLPVSVPIDIERTVYHDHLIRSASLPVLVDFWAPWCGPCRMMAPEIAKVAQMAAGQCIVVKINTEALPHLAQRYAIRSIPTLTVMKGGHELTRSSGARPGAVILNFLRQAAGF